MKSLIIVVSIATALVLCVTGCSSNSASVSSNKVVVPPHSWVVVYLKSGPDSYWEVTSQKIGKIGKLLGKLQKPNGLGTWSNVYPAGTNFYAIPGINAKTTAFALEVHKGEFVKATFNGLVKP